MQEKMKADQDKMAERKGSITIYLSLMMTLMISLIMASILSVKVQAGRMQLANSVDQAMFSLFGQYDRELLDKYDVFFLDGSRGASGLHIEKCYDRLLTDMSYILKPNENRSIFGGKNLLTLNEAKGSVTGYTLATDAGGAPFASQIVDYMKDTIGLQGLSLLLARVTQPAETVRQQENENIDLAAGNVESTGAAAGNGISGQTYADLEAASAEAVNADAEAAEADRLSGGTGETEAQANAAAVPEDFVNPLPALTELKNTSILNLVIKDTDSISQKTMQLSELLSGREKESGMGVVSVKTDLNSTESRLLFNEFILKKFGTYRKPSERAGLSYQLEYILQGKDSDISNLEGVVTKILLMREAANMVFLLTNAQKHAEIQAASEAIAALLLLPGLAPVLSLLFTAGWAFLESVIDLRGLLSGHRMALVKTESTWQVDIRMFTSIKEGTPINGAATDFDSFIKDDPQGFTYEEYLRILLFLTAREKVTAGCMDMAENTIRSGGREKFRLDCCIDSLSVEMNVRSEERITFTTEKTFCYRDL